MQYLFRNLTGDTILVNLATCQNPELTLIGAYMLHAPNTLLDVYLFEGNSGRSESQHI
jgi:hypothetical protein